ALRLLSIGAVEDDAWQAIVIRAAPKSIGEKIVFFPCASALAGRVDVVPVLHVVRLEETDRPVETFRLVSERVLDVLRRRPVHARRRPALEHARRVRVVPPDAPTVDHDAREDGKVAATPAVRRHHTVGVLLRLASLLLAEVLVDAGFEPLVDVV